MIRKTSKGYIVYSQSGRRLSRPYASRAQAQRRLAQIEYFKQKGK